MASSRKLLAWPFGYFGASTGAAAALLAAADRPEVGAVVSRGGRPDLAGSALARVKAPTLLIVGGNDQSVIELNKKVLDQLKCEKQLVIVPGATHLFEEPGTLDQVADLARGWLTQRANRTRFVLWFTNCSVVTPALPFRYGPALPPGVRIATWWVP